MLCGPKTITLRGNLSVADRWAETAPVTVSYEALDKGRCVGYAIPPEALKNSACSTKSPDRCVCVGGGGARGLRRAPLLVAGRRGTTRSHSACVRARHLTLGPGTGPTP
jgi:hypothetical protein